MRNKKLISWLSAAAMAASSFVPFANIASAETETLWSDTFNSYENTVTADTDGAAVPTELGGTLLAWGRLTAATTYTGIPGVTLQTTNRADDSSYYRAETKADDETDKYISTTVSRFSNPADGPYDRGAKIIFNEEYAPADGKDLVISFDAMFEEGEVYRPELIVGGLTTGISINATDVAGIEAGAWNTFKVVVDENGSTLYMNGEATGATSDETTIKELLITDSTATGDAQKSPSHGSTNVAVGYPKVNLDNVVIYNADDGVNDATPPAEGQQQATPAPPTAVPTPEVAPSVPVPGNASMSNNFNAEEVRTVVSIGTEAQTEPDTSIAGLSAYIGARGNGADTGTNASIVSLSEGDNALRLTAGNFATAGRGPVIALTDNIDVTQTGESATMEFALKLSTAGTAGRLYFLKDRTQMGDKADGAYRNIAAVLTTDGTGSTITRGDNGEDVIGIDVNADEWMTVKFELAADQTYRVYINGEQMLKGDYVASGDNASQLNELPMLAIQSSKSDGPNYRSIATIDNMVVYSGEATEPTDPTAEPTQAPTPEPEKDPGDVDGVDGVTVDDAKAVMNAVLGAEGAEVSATVADVNGDGLVNMLDANYIAQKAMGKLASFDEVKFVTAAEAEVQTVALAATETDPTISAVLVGDAPAKAGDQAVFDIYVSNIPENELIKSIQINLPVDAENFNVVSFEKVSMTDDPIAFIGGNTNIVENEARYAYLGTSEDAYLTVPAEGRKLATLTVEAKSDLAGGNYTFDYTNVIVNATPADDFSQTIAYRLDNDLLYTVAPSFTVEGDEPVVTAAPDPDFGEGMAAISAVLVGEAPAKAGDQAVFDIYVSNVPENELIKSIQINLPVDANNFNVVSFEKVAMTEDPIVFVGGNTSIVENEARYVYLGTSEDAYLTVSAEGRKLATLTVEAKVDLANGEYSFPYANVIVNATPADDFSQTIEYRLDTENIDLAYPRFTVGTTEPTTEPTGEPTTEPTGEPTTEPTTEPTAAPSVQKPITEIVTDETVNLITGNAKVDFTVTDSEGTEVAYGEGWVVVDSEGNELTADEVEALATDGNDADYVKGLSVKVFGDAAMNVAAEITGQTSTGVTPAEENPITLEADALTFTGLKADKKITSFSIELPGDVTDALSVVGNYEVGYNADTNKTIIAFVATADTEYITTDGTLNVASYTDATKAVAPVYVTVTYETADGEQWLDNEYLYTGNADTDKISIVTSVTADGSADLDPTTPTEPTTAPSTEPTTEPSTAPTTEPTTEPTATPTATATTAPTPTATTSTIRPGGGSGGVGGGGSTGGGSTTVVNPGNPVIGGTQAFPVKLSEGQLTSGAAAIYSSSKTSNNTFTVNVMVNGANTTLFDGFDPVMVKVPYSLASSHAYDVVVRDSAGNIVTRSYMDNNTMYVALDNTSGTFTIVELPSATFSDVNHPWATEAISALANRNIINGVGDGLYDPDAGVTRAQLVKMIVEMYDLELVSGSEATFSDVSADAWYATYVATAEEYAITNGMGDGTFGPDDYITREQMATMLFRANDVLHVTMPSTSATVTYADDASISDWAKAAVYRMQQADMMSGIGDNLFDPTAVSTRAQAAAGIYKVFAASMTNATTWGF